MNRRTFSKTLAATLTAAAVDAAPKRRLKIGHTCITWGTFPNAAGNPTLEVAVKDIASLGFWGFETFPENLADWIADPDGFYVADFDFRERDLAVGGHPGIYAANAASPNSLLVAAGLLTSETSIGGEPARIYALHPGFAVLFGQQSATGDDDSRDEAVPFDELSAAEQQGVVGH